MDIHLLLNGVPGAGAEPNAPASSKTTEARYKTYCMIHALRFNAKWTYEAIVQEVKMTPSGVWKICQALATTWKNKTGRLPIINTLIPKLPVQTATINAENRRKTRREIAWMSGINACYKTLPTVFAKKRI
ncbi:hypothetical protein P167DRAFT_580284 [Morchella conica CCBAS932]|uniref:Winged helix-turn helix domain-containing protein n=1 Tax=Morchella conica CCBAS932 TaxID=1392247 RepID=A0A3N4KAZ8_9PEZI|nr:hypothetical protein P167DRAFT_580284 [Morchella conica CCBAS932]